MTRVLIVDDHEVVRTGVTTFLERRTRYQVVAEAADGAEAIAKAIETKPDVILLNGLRAAIGGE
jgi:two-component system, NarL family, response regulator LiaR